MIGRYDYIIIDCPPSLGTVTKNGLRISTGYVIPTIPDIVSTWGIYQIVDNVARFAADVGRPIPALGIVATKVQANNLHSRVIEDLRARRLGRFGDGGTHGQPPLFGYSGGSGTRNPEEVEHRFRRKWNSESGKWNTESGGSGTSIPEEVEQRFRRS